MKFLGSYSLIEPDGTKRTVEYTADAVSGFNAVVHKEPAAGAVPVHVASAPIAYAAHPAAPIAPIAYTTHTAAPIAYTAHTALPLAYTSHAIAPLTYAHPAINVAHPLAYASSYYH